MGELHLQKYVLSLDLGSSGLKTAIISDSGDVAAYCYEPYDTIVLPDGGAEQDAETWWKLCLETSKRVIADSGAQAEQILSLIHISEPTRPTRASRMPSSA